MIWIDLELIRSRLDYDAGAGELRWKAHDAWPPNIAARFVGQVAGCPNNKGYVRVCVDKVYYHRHRLIWALHYNTETPPDVIDHINRVPGDDRIENLRAADNSLNSHNSDDVRGEIPIRGITRNGSGFVGKYQLQGVVHRTKTMRTIEEAQSALEEIKRTA